MKIGVEPEDSLGVTATASKEMPLAMCLKMFHLPFRTSGFRPFSKSDDLQMLGSNKTKAMSLSAAQPERGRVSSKPASNASPQHVSADLSMSLSSLTASKQPKRDSIAH